MLDPLRYNNRKTGINCRPADDDIIKQVKKFSEDHPAFKQKGWCRKKQQERCFVPKQVQPILWG